MPPLAFEKRWRRALRGKGCRTCNKAWLFSPDGGLWRMMSDIVPLVVKCECRPGNTCLNYPCRKVTLV